MTLILLAVFFSIIVIYYSISKIMVEREVVGSTEKKREYITPVLVFSLSYSIYCIIGFSDHAFSSFYSIYDKIVFAFSFVIGLIFFLLGYGIDDSISNSIKKNTSSKITTNNIFNRKISIVELALWGIFFLSIILFRDKFFSRIVNFGTGASYLDYSIRMERTSSTGLLSALSSYFTLTILVLPFYRVWKFKKVHLLDVFIFVIISSYSFFSGDRTNLVLGAFLIIVLINNRYEKINISAIIIGFSISLFFFILIGHLRRYNSIDDMLLLVKREGIKELLQLDSSGEFKYTTQTLLDYIHSISSKKMNFNFGYTYIIELLMLIPTFIFPNRPKPLNEQYMNIFYPDAISGTGHAWFILTDGYMSFGIIGIAFEMLIYGKIIKLIYKKFFECNHTPIRDYLYSYFLLYVFYSIRSSMVLTLKNYIISIAPILVFLFLIKKYEKEDYYD